MFGRSPSDRPRPIDQLVDEVRGESASEPDWDAIQQRVFQEIRRQRLESERVPASERSTWLWPSLAVAVGAVALMVRASGMPGSAPPMAAAVSEEAPVAQAVATSSALDDSKGIDGDGLEIGARIEASSSDLTVHHRAHVDWTLAAGSVARLVATGEVVTVELERGSVRSEVVPVHAPESFSVLAADTRVSVHGTVFTVTLDSGVVDVDVEEGIVGVAPVTRASEQTLLEAPAQGRFRVGELINDADERPAPVAVSVSKPAKIQKAPPREIVSTPPSSWQPPSEAWTRAYNTAVAGVERGIGRCFGEFSGTAAGVSIRAKTSLTLKVTPSGQVLSADFKPPLSPAVASCSERVIEATSFPESPEGSHLSHSLELYSAGG